MYSAYTKAYIKRFETCSCGVSAIFPLYHTRTDTSPSICSETNKHTQRVANIRKQKLSGFLKLAAALHSHRHISERMQRKQTHAKGGKYTQTKRLYIFLLAAAESPPSSPSVALAQESPPNSSEALARPLFDAAIDFHRERPQRYEITHLVQMIKHIFIYNHAIYRRRIHSLTMPLSSIKSDHNGMSCHLFKTKE